jgi:hypothetical protein
LQPRFSPPPSARFLSITLFVRPPPRPPTETPSTRTAADIKDHTANIGVLESILYFNHCGFNGHDSAIVRAAYHGFVERLGGVKPVVPAPEALTLNAKDCHDLAIEISGLVGWHAREGNRPASQE